MIWHEQTPGSRASLVCVCAAHASKRVARLDRPSMYKHIERVPPPIAYTYVRVIVLAGGAQRICVYYLQHRKQLPGCKGHWRRNMKPVSLYLRLLINVKLPEILLDRPRAGPDPGRRPSIPPHAIAFFFFFFFANNCSGTGSSPGHQWAQSKIRHALLTWAKISDFVAFPPVFRYAISMWSCNSR